MLSISSRTAFALTVSVFALLRGAAPAAAAESAVHNDRERIGRLSATAATGEWRERQAALEELREAHGAFAVNGLLRWIGSRADAEAREKAVFAMRRLQGDAVLAMLAGLHSPDAMTRRNLCLVLEAAGDARCGAALAALAEHDEDAIVRRMADEARAKLGLASTDSAAAQWIALSRDALGSRCTDPCAVFFWNGREIGSRACTPAIYGPAYALLFAGEALRLDPANTTAQQAFGGAAAALFGAISKLGAIPDPNEALNDSTSGAADEGSEDEGSEGMEEGADDEGMDDEADEGDGGGAAQDEGAAEETIEFEAAEEPEVELADADRAAWLAIAPRLRELVALGGGAGGRPKGASELAERDDLEGAAQLIASPDKRYRYRAALTLVGPGASAQVVSALADALGESAVRQILVIDPDAEEANALVDALSARDHDVVVATTGAMGLVRAKEAPKDVILLSTDVSDLDPVLIVHNLKRDDRTKDAAIVVITSGAMRDKVTDVLGSAVVAVLPRPVSKAMLQPALTGAFEAAALNDERMNAEQFARRAAEALASLDAGVLAPATAALLHAIGRDDSVQIPALIALSKLGPPEAEEAARAVFTDKSASLAARVAAGRTLWGVLEDNEGHAATLSALADTLRESDNMALRAIAAQALGSARGLAPAKRGELLLALNVTY